jgi:hypothetical protein
VPRYGDASLADLLPAVLDRLGVPGPAATVDLPPASRYAVLLVDGLGDRLLRDHPAEAPFLTSLLAGSLERTGGRPLTAVYPTTTPVALTSLGTGLPPGEHGLTGLFMRLPGRAHLLDLLHLGRHGSARDLQPRPTCFERAVADGVAVTRVGPKAFDGDGLTEAGLRGGDYAGAESVGERVDAVVAGLRRAGRALVYGYFGDLDATGHRRGVGSGAWRRELSHVDRLVEQLAAALPEGAVLVVTADHGMVDVPPGARWDLATTPALAAGVETVAGDPRAVHVHVEPGAQGDVAAAWRETLGSDFWVLTRAEAVEAGWFGPVVPDPVLPRIGEVVAAARTPVAVVDSRWMHPAVLGLVGLHGSLTPAELDVPLLVTSG